MRGCR